MATGFKWQLAKDYLSYHFSSARFYETGIDEFGFLKNIFTLSKHITQCHSERSEETAGLYLYSRHP